MKPAVAEEYQQIDQMPWAPFPEALSKGGIRWKLLHVGPEMGAWTAYFGCPAGSAFNAHVHQGPGEYVLTKGRMDVRGGRDNGGDTAVAPGYGYESAGARHDLTNFPVDSEFYMSFLGPLVFINEDGSPIVAIGWKEVQGAWQAFLDSQASVKKAA
ncbi:hypothetical protein DFR24_1318 [Panacagrimonas perspica]|uniref:ChrR-like cupin domain-containing protein n=1 Tax=Panacagrimonas perspica TaxID=381431 RepID=A0A4R7PCS6_9GAMM|nr:2,4'-dihydroxyacetophenone dioxygenase family protein [Panacagrimonas perspica]TDU31934.1 hypothetical protein DFR24_1318 [Panacagrimonas perspica]THD04251.1 acetylacetone-cleaving protein [Panacagrimonas perspica]